MDKQILEAILSVDKNSVPVEARENPIPYGDLPTPDPYLSDTIERDPAYNYYVGLSAD